MEDACGCLMAVSSVGGAGGATSAAVGHQSHPAQRQGERAAEQRMRRPALTAPLPLLLLLLLLGCWRPLHASARVTAKARKPRPQVRNAAPQPWASLDPPPGSPAYTSMVRPRDYYRVYRNLYYQNGRWYAFVEPGSGGAPEIEEGLTSNNAVFKLPIADLKNFTNGLNMHYVRGNTVIQDFPFQAYPLHLGHWLELNVPTWNMVLTDGWEKHTSTGSRRVHQLLLPNSVGGDSQLDWVMTIQQMTLYPAHGTDHPEPRRIDYYRLAEADQMSWIVFENLLVPQDRYTHPWNSVGFRGHEHGDLWRYDGCDRYVNGTFVPAFEHPSIGEVFRSYAHAFTQAVPRADGGAAALDTLTLVTYERGEDTPRVANAVELLAALEAVATRHGLKAREVVMNEEVPFPEQLQTFATSAVIVGRQSPMLANTVFLPPGAMVVELLPFKWEWHLLSMLYYNMTQSIGDIHHFAWRPSDASAARYKPKGGALAEPIRYKDWYPEECHARECLQPQGSADLVVDVAAVVAMLDAKLPRVRAGESVEALKEPWPVAV